MPKVNQRARHKLAFAMAGLASLSAPGALAQTSLALAAGSVTIEQPVGATLALDTSRSVASAIFLVRNPAGSRTNQTRGYVALPLSYVSAPVPYFGRAVVLSREALSVGITTFDPANLALANAGRELVLAAALSRLGPSRRTIVVLAQFN